MSRAIALFLLAIGATASGCAAPSMVAPSGSAASPPPAVASVLPGDGAPGSAASPSTDPWADALDRLDRRIRESHPNPFAIHPESEWVAKLAELKTTLPSASPAEQFTQLSGLTGLLDTHSGLSGPTHVYPVWLYRFAEGWFVVRAKAPSLVGSRLVAIGTTPIEDVERALRPLVPADNESGKLIGLQERLTTAELLQGLGIVADPTKPGFVFEASDGARATVDMTPEFSDGEFASGLIGYLMGDAPEAVARRDEAVWTRIDQPTRTFILAYNDYEDLLLPAALAKLGTALDDGSAKRVIVDMRYLQGGNGSLARPLIDALKADKRINRPGGLTVLIGRENRSAGTVVAGALDRETQAVIIGESTPARADNFLCDCVDIPIGDSPFVATVPTQSNANGDTRDGVLPDVPFTLTTADFFAGRDPALDLALSGAKASPSP